MNEKFPERVKEGLRLEVGGYCSVPFCGILAQTYDGSRRRYTLTGDAAHICGARPTAARYDQLAQGADRHGEDNGIWLCAVCHRMVDNSAELFPAETLYEWKYWSIQNYREGGRARMPLYNASADLASDHKKADDFLSDIWPVTAWIRSALFSIMPDNRFHSGYSLTPEVAYCIRDRAGRCYNSKAWNARHPQWTYTPDLRAWQDEIVRQAKILSDMPVMGIFQRNPYIDMHYTREPEGGLFFHYKEASAFYMFAQMLRRFDEFLTDYKGPQSAGMPFF